MWLILSSMWAGATPVATVVMHQGEARVERSGATEPVKVDTRLELTDVLVLDFGASIVLVLENNQVVRLDEDLRLKVSDIKALNESPASEQTVKDRLAKLLQPTDTLSGQAEMQETISGWHARPSASTSVTTTTREAADEEPPAIAPAPASAPSYCHNLIALEPPALMGQLGDATEACLEERFAADEERATVSLLLIRNAEAQGDKKKWERLVLRHVQLDDSDPNLTYKLALYYSRQGSAGAQQVILWAENAMEHSSVWTGDTLKHRLLGLHKLRTKAASLRWSEAEERGDKEASIRLRTTTRDYAKAWLDFARAQGEDTTAPMQLCVAGGGTIYWCSD